MTVFKAGFGQAPIKMFPIHRSPLEIQRAVDPVKPFTVAGEHGAILGDQNGVFEAWSFPVKVLSQFRIRAELNDYPVPIDVQQHAAGITVSPGLTTITYSHAAFTIRQRMFVPRGGAAAAPVVVFEIESVRPIRITFEFRPEMLRMWPASNFGVPNAEWVEGADNRGFYILHTDDPAFSAAIAIPHGRPGILAPYQERPKTWPVQFLLSFDPKKDAGLAYPLLIAMSGATSPKPAESLKALGDSVAQLYLATENYYAHFFDSRLTAHTPDPELDRALAWAAIAIDQGFVDFHGERGMTAGFYASGDSARPGFGWFFGRDALWTSFAMNSYGDFQATRDVLEFLIRRQRADGKIMHEFSQTADLVDWKATPYFYAAADASPLFVMAMEDYLNVSDDEPFLRKHWDAVKRAWEFTRAHDSDGDGIYENTEGTGWVESWPPGMPHQEIYLAALDQQSSAAISRLAARLGDAQLAVAAQSQADQIRARLEGAYFDSTERFYAFSRNTDGTLDRTATIYPAVAWWSGRMALEKPGDMLSRWASHEFSTDWGLRDISPRTSFYDPISYHQGSVWPLFTGWVALAEYRAGRPLSGYAHLMQNAGLTWAQDPGSLTELLSGEFFQPLGRSSSHQIWSSAMVLSPAIRGLFGLDWDAARDTIYVHPHLPASWDRARLDNVPLGERRVSITFERRARNLSVHASAGKLCGSREAAGCGPDLTIPLPPVEIEIPAGLPQPGAVTSQVKAIAEQRTASSYVLELEGQGGAQFDFPLRSAPGVRFSGAEARGAKLHVEFPPGEGYRKLTVRAVWGVIPPAGNQ
jgi:glycogen debranching enzyme